MSELKWYHKLIDFVFEGKFWCKLGLHAWSWELEDDGIIYLDSKIPDRAKCSTCGITFKGENYDK